MEPGSSPPEQRRKFSQLQFNAPVILFLPTGETLRQASALNAGVMAVAEAKYGRMDESLRYVDFIADGLDVEQPGALPELFNSPDYPYFPSFAGAMVMQAWDSYGIHWPLIEYYLGIQPDVPADSIVVVPCHSLLGRYSGSERRGGIVPNATISLPCTRTAQRNKLR